MARYIGSGPLVLPTTLNIENVGEAIRKHEIAVQQIGNPTTDLEGYELLKALKRRPVERGPIPHVTLFEAANRILTNFVILLGVRYLLGEAVFPFDQYHVEYGHDNMRTHDITASGNDLSLHGEAFNVAPSFFGGKKTSSLRKLRMVPATFNVLMVNIDVANLGYAPRLRPGESILFVDVDRRGEGTRIVHG